MSLGSALLVVHEHYLYCIHYSACVFSRKLTLQNLPWMVFEGDTPSDDDEKQFLQVVQQYSSPVGETVEAVETPSLDTTGPSQKPKRIRLNTKLRSQTTQ